jgi:hypothetical protein
MNDIIKQYIELGRVIGVKNDDLIGQFPNRQQTVKVKAPEPLPVIFAKPEATAEEALRLHGLHRNWATVARLMGMKKQEVLALVHAATQPSEGLTIAQATRNALNSKRYLTMKEIVSAVQDQNLRRPAYSGVVRRAVWQMTALGQAKVKKEIGQLTGYKLVG